MYSLLKEKNEGLKDELVAFAQALIRTPSPSLHEEEIAKLVEAQMKASHYDQVLRDKVGNVIGIMRGRDAQPTVLLNCHMDTVQAPRESLWNESPYSGSIRDGCLHGSGAADCKGGLAAHISVGALLKRSMLPLKGNLVVAATAAEENGLSIGTRALIEESLPALGLQPTYAILGEPTGMGLYYGHDGWVEMDVCIEGLDPFHVDDAAEAVLQDYTHRSSSEPAEFSFTPPRFENRNGVRCATIPVSRRLQSAEDEQRVLTQTTREVTAMTRGTGSVAVAVAVRQERQKLYNGQTAVVRHVTHAWSTDPFHPLMERARQSLLAAGCAVQPGKWNLGRIGMGTAGGLLTQFKVPTIGYGPGSEDKAHSINESVEIEKLAETVYGTAAIVHSLLGIPVFGWTSDEI